MLVIINISFFSDQLNKFIEKKYGTFFVPNNNLIFLKSGEEVLEKKIEIIRKAEKFIYIETFIFHDDHFGSKIAEELVKKSRDGIDIVLIYDVFGSFPKSLLDINFYDNLENEGIKLIKYSNLIEDGLFEVREVWHRKTIIVDNKYAFIGGSNLNAHMFKREKDFLALFGGSLEANRDTTVFVEGPIVYELYKDFVDYTQFTELKLEKKYMPNHDFFDTDIEIAVISYHPNIIEENLFENLIIDLINNAKNYILFEIGYFTPTLKIIKAFENAVKREVNITILISYSDISNMPWREELSKFLYKELIDMGIKIYSHKKNPIHSKIGVFDDLYTILGTVNIDGRSMILDVESTLLIKSKIIAKKSEGWILSGIEDSEMLDLSYLSEFGIIKYLYNGYVRFQNLVYKLLSLK